MAKNIKRVLALVLCALLVSACFAGCGSSSGTDTTKKADASEAASSGSAENGTLTIGATGPLTGDASTYGISVKEGATLAVNEINAAGGVNGIKLKFIMEDDELKDTNAVNAYSTLVDEGMQVCLGSVTSVCCTALKAEAEKDGMFYITPSASSKDAISDYAKGFRVCFSDPNQGAASAQYIAENMTTVKNVAILYDSSDNYSTGIHDSFKNAISTKGYKLNVAVDEAFTADSNTDFSVQLQKIKDANCDLLFLPIYYTQAASILTQADQLGLKVQVFGCDGLDGVIKTLGDKASLAEGVMLLTPFAANATDDKTTTFVKAYEAAYGEKDVPNQFAADGYDAVYIIKAALEKAGVKSASGIDISALGDKLAAAMTQITVDGVTGLGITWSAEGEPTKSPKAMKIVNGEYSAVE